MNRINGHFYLLRFPRMGVAIQSDIISREIQMEVSEHPLAVEMQNQVLERVTGRTNQLMGIGWVLSSDHISGCLIEDLQSDQD